QSAPASLVAVPRVDVGLPRGLDLDLHALDVVATREESLRVALTWNGVQSANSTVVATRGAVLGLRVGRPPFLGLPEWTVDPDFGGGGYWMAPSRAGRGEPLSTTVHRLLLDRAGHLVAAGSATSGTARSLYVAWLDDSGTAAQEAFPCQGVVTPPIDPVIDANNRVIVGGSNGIVDNNRSADPTETMIVRLARHRGPDAPFGTKGVATPRLHGGTHLGAVMLNADGTLLATSFVRWGLNGSAIGNHLCVTRLTSNGAVDPTFGSSGMARHNGLGNAEFEGAFSFSSSPF